MSDDYDNGPRARINQIREHHGVFSFEGQALQYDQFGPPDEIVYRRYTEGQSTWIDCLLHYDANGKLDAIFNTYPFGSREPNGATTELPGNSNAFVRPDVPDKEGLYRRLLADARRRWPNIRADEVFEMEFIYANGRPAGKFQPRPFTPMRGDGWDGNRRISRLKR